MIGLTYIDRVMWLIFVQHWRYVVCNNKYR